MAPISIIGALSALPLVLAHMQMSSPSPLRDPHATDRPQEPKDYNILSPLNADGSNFACKGYHLNTPLTTVATYAAGSKQTLRLKGSATHGGGSCQISMSCDGGNDFRVMKSIVGGCPLKDSYDFTVPKDMPAAKKCLLAWTWFNRIGNREMYMNCAVVDITNKNKGKRDTQASAVTALARFPELFVANLANINSCKIQETTDAIFDDPGKDVSYGNGDSSSMKSAFSKGQCTGKPSKNAGSKDTSSSNSGGGGQWTPPATSPSQAGDCVAKIASGQWHPECSGGQSQAVQQRPQPQQQEQVSQQSQQPQKTKQNAQKKLSKGKPNTRVQEELDAYLATLSGRDLARRDAMPAAKRHELHSRLSENSIKQHAHIHTENCEHEMDDYAPVSHYRNEEDLDPYPEDGIDFSNKNAYSTQDSQNDEDPYSAYKRVSRQQRWTSYNKRADTPRVPITFHRGDESAYYKQQAQNQASTDAVKDTPAEASPEMPTDTTASAPDEAPAKKNWSDMTDSERFNAYLQRMVELSNNLASLIKYAAASSVNVPYYPSAARGIAPAPESVQGTASEGTDTAVPRLARRGVLSHSVSSAQAYPGPGNIGSISDAGEATDSDDGFKKWFPNLVQTSRAKRQLVDPVTSEASAQAGDSVNFFDALLAGISKLFGDPFNLYSDDPDTSGAPGPEDIPLVLGEPDIYSKPPFIPDFDIPDLDGHFNFPPQIPAPELPVPELLPGGESDPLTDDFPADVPTIIISIDPVTSTDDVFPGLDVPTMTPCVQPIPQIGFNSCWGGCNHTAEEIAQHEVYLKTFAEEEAAYTECLANQTSDNSSSNGNSSSHPHKILYEPDDDSEDGWQFEPEDASGRKPRPGQSLPLIPSPIPDNYTLPYPLNSTDPFNSTETASSPTLDSTDPGSNATDSLPLLPYQNKTLGELVNDILKNPVMLDAPEGEVVNDTNTEAIPGLTPVPSDSSDDLPPIDQPSGVVNPLQEAADQTEEGVTVPQDPAVVEPNALETIADALPWFMGHGPVVTPGVSAGVIGLQ